MGGGGEREDGGCGGGASEQAFHPAGNPGSAPRTLSVKACHYSLVCKNNIT